MDEVNLDRNEIDNSLTNLHKRSPAGQRGGLVKNKKGKTKRVIGNSEFHSQVEVHKNVTDKCDPVISQAETIIQEGSVDDPKLLGESDFISFGQQKLYFCIEGDQIFLNCSEVLDLIGLKKHVQKKRDVKS